MGRKKLLTEEKKQTVSIRIPNELVPLLNNVDNKSKFFELLLIEYFKNIHNERY